MTRDERGRFIKGHENVGAGRKPKTVEDAYLDLFKEAVTSGDWVAIIRRAVDQARKGDAPARKFIADYLIGPAVQKIAPTTPDGENPYMGAETSELIRLARKITHAEDTGE